MEFERETHGRRSVVTITSCEGRHTASMTLPGATATTRIVLVEDHPIYAAGLRTLLADAGVFDVVGHASDGESAAALVHRAQPDVILLDISLGDENGLDLVGRFRRLSPSSRVIVLTGHEEQTYLMTAIRLEVQAFIQKDMPGDLIIETIQQVLLGERTVTSPRAMTAVLNEFSHLLSERVSSQLSTQEIDILALAAAGCTNKDIGARHSLSEVTIKRKFHEIYGKLHVSRKSAAVAEALRLGLI